MITLNKFIPGENVDLMLKGIALASLTKLTDKNSGSIALKLIYRLKNLEVPYFIINNDKIIGTICLGSIKNTIVIHDFAIFEEYQNQGFGKETLKSIIDKNKSYKIQLGVEKRNLRALNLYTKFGFRFIKEYDDGYLMEL